MRRLLWIFFVLIVVALLAAGTGIWLARGGRSLAGGPVVLAWDLGGALPDRPPAERIPLPGFEAEETFASAYRALRAARHDPAVRGLAVTLDGAGFGLAKAQELRRLLESVRAAGKFVDCYLETAGEGGNGTLDYYLATACDSIAMAPAGDLNLLGLYADNLFFRGALDKLKIDPQFRHAGSFKSAAETFTETRHSPSAREALDAVLDAFFRQIVAGVAERRGLQPAAVLALIDRAPFDAETAKAEGLLDAIAYPDEFDDAVERRAEGARRVDLDDYLAGAPVLARGGRHVAVLFAEGTILRGGSSIDPWTGAVTLGSRHLSETLDDLREDDSVAAVVLRIDSPGGSALASDLILRAATRFGEAKPLVASFSDVAASGGYYIAARAGKIVAEAGSITGSIGVVAGKFATRRLEEELLGVTRDPVARGRRAGLYASAAPFSDEEDATFRAGIDRTYARFLGHVAEGRGLDPAVVARIAEGRVWVGEDARRLGLVDELGGLDRSIALARDLAGLAPDPEGRAHLPFYPRPRSVFDQIFGGGDAQVGGGASWARAGLAVANQRGRLPGPWWAAARALAAAPGPGPWLAIDPLFLEAFGPSAAGG